MVGCEQQRRSFLTAGVESTAIVLRQRFFIAWLDSRCARDALIGMMLVHDDDASPHTKHRGLLVHEYVYLPSMPLIKREAMPKLLYTAAGGPGGVNKNKSFFIFLKKRFIVMILKETLQLLYKTDEYQ